MTRNRLAAVIALIGCTAGCATTGGKISAVVGTVAAAGAIATATTSHSCDANRDDGGGCILTVATVGGLGLVAAAAYFVAMVFESYGAATAPAQPPARAALAPARPAASPTVAVAARAPRATLLTRQASIAARVGHCYTVGALAPQVQAIDPDYYERVFAADPAIASCRTDQDHRR